MPREFKPDVRNIGGRSMLILEHQRHKDKLNRVRSTLDNGEPIGYKVRPKSAGAARPKKVLVDEYREVRNTFEKVSKVKPSINMRPTVPTDMTARLSDARKKKENEALSQHYLNIEHMKRRIRQMDTYQERKKNAHDPRIYPSLVKRVGVDIRNGTQNDKLKKSIQQEEAATARKRPTSAPPTRSRSRPTSARTTSGSRPTSARRPVSARPASARPASARPASARSTPGSAKKSETKSSSQQPDGNVRRIETTQDPYKEFKHALVDIIVSNRIYQEDDLANLFAQSIDLNPHLDRNKMEAVTDELKQELDMM
eukprot:GFYU01000890.1.p1 GENE.GFYU01000890.1~~GFYU01000890.1.p1  ORF type:complete len:312 (+),score=35.83 GFYU01000890.1:152-1087(+)